MSEGTDIVRDLIAAGVAADLVARVAVMASRLTDLDRRRASDANRQRSSRARRHVTSCDSGESHVTSRASRDVTPGIYTTPKIVDEPKKAHLHARAKSALPTTWELDEQDRIYAQAKGWPPERVEAEAERFKNHALANGRRQKDWHAAWRNWVTSPFQKPERINGSGGSVLEAGRRIDAALKAAGATSNYVPGSSGPRPLELDQFAGADNIRRLSAR